MMRDRPHDDSQIRSIVQHGRPPSGPAEGRRTLRIAFLEPYDGGSHRAFREGLTAHSRHEIRAWTLPPRFWKWRMRGAAPWFADRLREGFTFTCPPDTPLSRPLQRALQRAPRPGALALHQPAANQLPENGNFLWRTQAFAMNDANAALAPVQALGQEGRKQLARFIAIQTMQVNFILSDPTAAS